MGNMAGGVGVGQGWFGEGIGVWVAKGYDGCWQGSIRV